MSPLRGQANKVCDPIAITVQVGPQIVHTRISAPVRGAYAGFIIEYLVAQNKRNDSKFTSKMTFMIQKYIVYLI
jgi:hypothetical protein